MNKSRNYLIQNIMLSYSITLKSETVLQIDGLCAVRLCPRKISIVKCQGIEHT